MTGWHGPLLTFLVGAFSEVMNWDVKINCGAEMKVYRRTPSSGKCGGKYFRCGAEMRGSVGRRSSTCLPGCRGGKQGHKVESKLGRNHPRQKRGQTDSRSCPSMREQGNSV